MALVNLNAMTVVIPKFKIGERLAVNPRYGGGTMTVIGYEDSDPRQLYYYCVRECTEATVGSKRLLNYRGTDRELHAEEDLATSCSEGLGFNDNGVLKWKNQ